MTQLEEIKEEFRSIVKEDLHKGLGVLLKKLQNRELLNKVHLQDTRLKKLRGHVQGIISYDNHSTELSQIYISLFEIIDLIITEDDLIFGFSRMGEEIAELDITEKLTSLYLVNCNREIENDSFWSVFDIESNNQFQQFFFLPACGYQCSDDFAEKIIILIRDYLASSDNSDKSILFNEYDYTPKYGKKTIKRLKPTTIGKIGSPIEIQINFNKFINENIFIEKNDNNRNFTLDQWFDEVMHGFTFYTYVINFVGWSKYNAEFCNKIISTFSQKKTGKSTFLFFFVIKSNSFHTNPDPQIIQDIEKISDIETGVVHIKGFEPVTLDEVQSWMDSTGITKTGNRDSVIELFKQRYNIIQEDKSCKCVNMSHVKELMEMTYSIHTH